MEVVQNKIQFEASQTKVFFDYFKVHFLLKLFNSIINLTQMLDGLAMFSKLNGQRA